MNHTATTGTTNRGTDADRSRRAGERTLRRARLALAAAVALGGLLAGTGAHLSLAQPAAPAVTSTPRPRPAAGPAPAPAAAAAPGGASGASRANGANGAIGPNAAANQRVGQAALEDSHKEMAEKLSTAAMDLLHHGLPGEHQWREAAALLRGACTLDPAEPSYSRLLAEAWRQLGDNKQVIAALNEYRRAGKAAQWPDDQVVAVELIDRYLSEMESDDARLKYLRGILSMTTLAPEVKAHAAVLAVPLLVQRSETEAGAMLQQALQLDPLNLPAWRMEYQSVAAVGTPLQRVQVLLRMEMCNPCQRDVMLALAHELAEAGLPDLSNAWYRGAMILTERIGAQFDNSLTLEYATQLYASGNTAEANRYVGDVLLVSPRNPDAAFMRLAFDRVDPIRAGNYQNELEITKHILVAQAAAVARKIVGQPRVFGTPPPGAAPVVTTRPTTSPTANPPEGPAPDSAPDVANRRIGSEDVTHDALARVLDLIKQRKAQPEWANAFLAAASDLAWFHLYFEEAPDEAARWVNVVKVMLPANDPRVRRLQGWLDLESKRFPQAYAQLAPIQDTDPLAAIGIIRMTGRNEIPGAGNPAKPPATRPAAPAARPAAPAARPTAPATRPPAPAAVFAVAPAAPATAPAGAGAPTTRGVAGAPGAQEPQDPVEAESIRKADVLAQKLLSRTRTGLAAAIAHAAYRSRRLQPDARADAAALRDEVNRFPGEWVQIIDRPDRFYYIFAKPVKLKHSIGEPLWAWVTIHNKSKFDLTIGPDGVLSPDLFFDVRTGMMSEQTFPMAAYDRIANVLVLPANGQTSQLVRVDQGPIVEALRHKPARNMTLFARVTTNPIVRENKIVAGPAGMPKDFYQQFIRTGTPMFDLKEKQTVLGGLTNLPSTAMLTLDVLSAHVEEAREPDAGDGDQERKGRIVSMAPDLLAAIEGARRDEVPDVAGWATYQAERLAAPERKPELIEALRASPDWEVRLLAGVAAVGLPAKDRKPLADALSHDADPLVKEFGAALAEDLVHPTGRAATTQPSARPASPAQPASRPAQADQSAQGGHSTTAPVTTAAPAAPAPRRGPTSRPVP